jgi:hypothetical protein
MTSLATLTPVQGLPTDCARCVQPLHLDGQLHLAIAQFARDVEGQSASMHAGDSNLNVQLYRWTDGAFAAIETLPVAGAEDAEYFEIEGREFLACASIRSGAGPYEHDVHSPIFERVGGRWVLLQSIATFGAKQWRYLNIQGRHLLALAQGFEAPGVTAGHPDTSRIYAWNGQQFEPFQVLDGRWGYNWTAVQHEGRQLLAYADHLAHSPVLQWRDGRFEPWISVPQTGGRAWVFFEDQDRLLGVFASISGTTVLGQLNDDGFTVLQELGGAGGRDLALLEHRGQRYLARVSFITGSREAPQTVQQAQLFVWQDGRFALADTFQTFGATSASWFVEQGQPYLAVSNSLSADVRFRNDSQIYRLNLEPSNV